MKKFVAVLLALSLVLTMAFAMAEEVATSTYMMVAVADAEGNVVDMETVELPVLVLVIENANESATGACAFGTEDAMVEGTYEILAGEDGVMLLNATLTDGSEVAMAYVAEDDCWMLVDESGMSMFLYNVEALAE